MTSISASPTIMFGTELNAMATWVNNSCAARSFPRRALILLGASASIAYLLIFLYLQTHPPLHKVLERPWEISQAVVLVKVEAEDVRWAQKLRPSLVSLFPFLRLPLACVALSKDNNET